MNEFRHELTRRKFLKQSVAFSLANAVVPSALLVAKKDRAPDATKAHILCLGDWGTNTEPDQQIATAEAMKNWVERYQIQPKALMMLGDNWYGDLAGDVESKRWHNSFEQMYPETHFPGPVYAVLGNHDYEHRGSNKLQAELAYARLKATRWRLPYRWYRFSIPEHNPLVTFLCLDSNLPGTKGFDWQPWSFTMNHSDRRAQNEWLRKQLAQTKTSTFLIATGHHPLYSNGGHGDNTILIREWDELFRHHQVDIYLAGHDHDLQHLEFAGHPTSFVISGGGGAKLVDWSQLPESRGAWGERVLGFTDLEIAPASIVVRHIASDAHSIYAFRRDSTGRVTILK